MPLVGTTSLNNNNLLNSFVLQQLNCLIPNGQILNIVKATIKQLKRKDRPYCNYKLSLPQRIEIQIKLSFRG